ncbi:unnamed protein product [Caenorhabditis angaria]|uniref:Uncharacterized protein n=1 Tax=Caenorhabditis angaria TaxID=860376 RepID=A0A9P1IE34_9PELO|nr:unnamed protein product [Caenorhabditis angaria]
MWNIKRGLLISCATFWVLLTYCSDFWVKQGEGYVIGNRRRIIATLRIECILTSLNVFAYGQLMQWFGEDKDKHRRLQVNNIKELYLSGICAKFKIKRVRQHLRA